MFLFSILAIVFVLWYIQCLILKALEKEEKKQIEAIMEEIVGKHLHKWEYRDNGMVCKECSFVAGTHVTENGQYD